jgi:hypothetical protein
VRTLKRNLRGNFRDRRRSTLPRARKTIMLRDEFRALVESAPSLHLLDFAPHVPAEVVDVERVGETRGEDGCLEVVGACDVRLQKIHSL